MPTALIPHAKFSLCSLFILSPLRLLCHSARDLVTDSSGHFHCWRRSETSHSWVGARSRPITLVTWLVTKILAVPIQTTWLEWGKGLFSKEGRGTVYKTYSRGSLAIPCDVHIGSLLLDRFLERKSFSSCPESPAGLEPHTTKEHKLTALKAR